MTVGSTGESYEFAGGYPTPETVRRAYDEADLNRAVQAYRFFYPGVSIMATWKGNLRHVRARGPGGGGTGPAVLRTRVPP